MWVLLIGVFMHGQLVVELQVARFPTEGRCLIHANSLVRSVPMMEGAEAFMKCVPDRGEPV